MSRLQGRHKQEEMICWIQENPQVETKPVWNTHVTRHSHDWLGHDVTALTGGISRDKSRLFNVSKSIPPVVRPSISLRPVQPSKGFAELLESHISYMKLSEKIAKHDSTRPFYTFEFFPPRTDQVSLCLIGSIITYTDAFQFTGL